jgi:hypothetical protein
VYTEINKIRDFWDIYCADIFKFPADVIVIRTELAPNKRLPVQRRVPKQNGRALRRGRCVVGKAKAQRQ